MRNRKIVALVPAYNPNSGELTATIGSLLRQTIAVDLCVIDDGSARPVAPMLPADDRIHVIRLDQNGGITTALRAGVAYALDRDYEFMCRLDVGDISHPERLALQRDFLEGHPDVDLVGGVSRVVDLDWQPLFLHGVSGSQAAHAYLLMNTPFKHSTFVFRSDAIRRCGTYDEGFNGAEDYELLLRFARYGRIDCIPQVVTDYVDNPAGISATRRGLQLRMRLKAQLRYARPMVPGWYAGVFRTLLTIATPYGLMKRVSTWTWSRRGRRLEA
jgi:glycosyltransferase involved in cell wall biosynthesis